MPGYFLLKPGFSSVCPAAQGEVTYAILSVDQVSTPQAAPAGALSPGLDVVDAVSWLPVHGTPT
jgi:hypothetical protein